MKTEHKTHYCPSKEELSNWYDNGGDDTIKDHLEVCAPCDETVGFYKKVDETVCYVSAAPDYLATDIAEACRNLERETLAFPLWARLARIAAVAAVVVSVAAAVHVMTAPGDGADTRLVIGGESSGNTETGVTLAVDEISLNAKPDTVADLNPVTVTDIRPVSINSTADMSKTQALTRLGDAVRHVWAVDDINLSRVTLLEALPKDVKTHCFSNVSDEKLTFQAAMSDAQLQNFVNTLQAKGWALVTKDFPQPGEINKLKLTGHSVNYRIDLVKKLD
ncbi:MAG: hypothetical protein RRC34_09320 [Lentisphaeria bacterium]|nr:hypothetical protein [Lentisphaeria bacterium]